MNEAFVAWVYPTLRFVLDALGVGQDRKSVSVGDQDMDRLKERLRELEVAGSASQGSELAKSALLHWVDEIYASASSRVRQASDGSLSGDVTVDVSPEGSKFFEEALGAKELDRPDAAETIYLCAALGYPGVYPDKESCPNSRLPATIEDWVGLLVRKIDPKLPERFDTFATAGSYDPELDALPLTGRRFLRRALFTLCAVAILALGALGVWIWLRFLGSG